MKHKSVLVVPCYNESERIPFEMIASFIENHPEVKFCFVNDGSTDRTLRLLHKFKERHPGSVAVLSLPRNCGKAEAVRQGVLSLTSDTAEYIGFWDADMATPLYESLNFLTILESRSSIDLVIGSRLPRLGAQISRKLFRSAIGRMIAAIISKYLGFDIYDSQCGAKIFRRDLALQLFEKPFVSRWLFDVELFKRILLFFSRNYPREHILEYPLNEWNDVKGSKLRFYHAGQIMAELLKIAWHYRKKNTFFATVAEKPGKHLFQEEVC